MKFLLDNWYIVLIGLILAVLAIKAVYTYINYPSEKKLSKVREWLLYAVTEAEKELGGGTGQIKLRYVYDMFLVKFPYLAKFVSFEGFSKLVDEALEKFRELLKTNKNISEYVKQDGEKNG